MGKKKTTTTTNQTQNSNSTSNSSSTSNNSSSFNNSSNPWAPAEGHLIDILGGAKTAYGAPAGPNENMTLGAGSGAQTALKNLGWMGNIGTEGMDTVRDINAGHIGGQGLFDVGSLGGLYNFADLNLADPTGVGSVVSTVAGDRPSYSPNMLKSNIADISSLVPNYDQLFRNSVAGATAPIMTNFSNNVIPAMLSRQATTGGTSSRHNIEATGLVDQLGKSIGDVVSSKGLDLANLQSGDFRTLAGISGSDTTATRGIEGQDWRTLAGIAGDAFGQNNQLKTQYQIASQQAAAQQAAERDRIMAQAFEQQQQRMQGASGLQLEAGGMLPGMEAAVYDNSLQPSRTLTGIGEQQKGWSDSTTWDPVTRYSNLVTPIAGLGGTQSGSQSGTQSGTQTGTESGTSNMSGTQVQQQSGGTLGSIVKGLAGIAGIAAPFMGGGNPLASLFGGMQPGSAAYNGAMANAFAGMPTMNITGNRRW